MSIINEEHNILNILAESSCSGKLTLCRSSNNECKVGRDWNGQWPDDITPASVTGNCCFLLFSKRRQIGKRVTIQSSNGMKNMEFSVQSVRKGCN